jgi:hypothetical protein
VRRDVWHGKPMVAWGGIVVADEPDLLALYMPEASPLRFAPDFFGAPHPWSHKDSWHGHGVLQLQRPGEMHAVWVFWKGAERRFAAWYVNVQEPFRRSRFGIDTQDLELDIVVSPDGSWRYKDDERLQAWIERGRWTAGEVAEIRSEAHGSGDCSMMETAGGLTSGRPGSLTRPGRSRPCRPRGIVRRTRGQICIDTSARKSGCARSAPGWDADGDRNGSQLTRCEGGW